MYVTEPDILPGLDPETAWLEALTIGGFRVWHIIIFCSASVLSLIIIICCCVKFRIPRTKQEIEADYQRKKIAKKFRERLTYIKNSEMDAMDLQKALARVQAEFEEETKRCNQQHFKPEDTSRRYGEKVINV